MATLPMTWEEAKAWRESQAESGRTVVFTNGVFDILHPGHVELLEACRMYGDMLVVGLNSDASVRTIKDPGRPIVMELDRARVLLGLKAVDVVVLFDEETPAELIKTLLPDILVKGGDYTPDTVVGRETVEAAGGRVVIVPLVEGRSTSNVVETVLSRYCAELREDPTEGGR